MTREYETVIGLEIHAELKTESKIYCSCRNVFGKEPNTQICPVCMGLPGALPVLNEKAVDYAVKMGHALNCRINRVSRQDRKNYFYPDLPKAYQISQADIPVCEEGYLEFLSGGEKKRVRITRIHIEEDAGKLIHDEESSGSLVNLNRCGVPLIEIVTEPEIRSSAEAKTFLDMIKSILQYIDISDCRMQEGSLRCDVNVSVREKGSNTYGTRCEMKNVNSFSAAVRGIEYESARQITILESGGTIAQETRRWDDANGESFVMRTKEDAQDYRFFPEPDLLTIVLDDKRVDLLKNELPELPNEKIFRYVESDRLPFTDAELIALDRDKAKLYDECVAIGNCTPKGISNRILSEVAKFTNDTGRSISETPLTARKLADLIAESESGRISSSAVKKVFEVIVSEGGEPSEIIERLGLAQNSDAQQLEQLAEEVIAANEKSVSDYENGKKNAIGYLVGQCMKASGGSANPSIIRELIEKALNK